MQAQSLTEDIDVDQQALIKAVPKSIKMRYREDEFNNVLKTTGAAATLYKSVLSRIENENTKIKITKILFPYVLRDLSSMIASPKETDTALELIYGFLWRVGHSDEWKTAISVNMLVDFLNQHKDNMVKLTLKEFKEFAKYSKPGHPTTARLSSLVRNLQKLVDWPELKTIYLSLHNLVFDDIMSVATRHNYNSEGGLIDYISRNHVNLDMFPKIKAQLDKEKFKILMMPVENQRDALRGMNDLRFWMEQLKKIGLGWPELNDTQAVYNLAKPFVIKNILTAFKSSKYYRDVTVNTDLNILKNYYKLNWPELEVIRKSANSVEKLDQ